MPVMRTAIVIPTLGAPSLESCLAALARQSTAPNRILIVHSGCGELVNPGSLVEILSSRSRLGFAAACNRGIAAALDDADAVALLNDDTEPDEDWLSTLQQALIEGSSLGAVQGTVTDHTGATIDGRGLAFDRWGLPIQVDRGLPATEDGSGCMPRWGVSATAAVFRSSALRSVQLADGAVFDEAFDCYHEDTDLGLRMLRLHIPAAWVPGALCRHLGSSTGSKLGWKHPWWIAANRWRAVAANLSLAGFFVALPKMARGELRVASSLVRTNPRAWLTEALVLATLPVLVAQSWKRRSSGPRLRHLPEPPR